MAKTLVDTLERVPNNLFWKDELGGVPHYKSILSFVLEDSYPSGSIPISDVTKDHFPNPSTFQRLVPKEANRRRQLMNGGGGTNG